MDGQAWGPVAGIFLVALYGAFQRNRKENQKTSAGVEQPVQTQLHNQETVDRINNVIQRWGCHLEKDAPGMQEIRDVRELPEKKNIIEKCLLVLYSSNEDETKRMVAYATLSSLAKYHEGIGERKIHPVEAWGKRMVAGQIPDTELSDDDTIMKLAKEISQQGEQWEIYNTMISKDYARLVALFNRVSRSDL